MKDQPAPSCASRMGFAKTIGKVRPDKGRFMIDVCVNAERYKLRHSVRSTLLVRTHGGCHRACIVESDSGVERRRIVQRLCHASHSPRGHDPNEQCQHDRLCVLKFGSARINRDFTFGTQETNDRC